MLKKKFILKILCVFHALSSVKSNLIKTTTGSLRGKLSCYGKTNYYSYEGIPFAEPPIGDLRFRPPVPKKPWDDTLEATSPGPVCPQPEYLYPRSEMDESCLFLNIYVPATTSNKLLPVVFFIHDGFYTSGSGRAEPIYGPQFLSKIDIILVVTNYRLGALGFLSFDDINASGNAGLKDILLASKWINSNIEKFGGDPNQICLYGAGAGGTLVHYMLLTKQSSGIFQSAVISSGSAIGYRSLQINPKENALKLARQLGIEYEDNQCLDELKEIDAFKIVEAEDNIIRNDPRRGFIFMNFFAPTIEKPSSSAILTRNPLDIIRREGLIQKIPVIIGFNNQEGLEIFYALKDDPSIVDKLNENFELCIPPDIRYPSNSKARNDLAKSIREFYFNGGNISIVNTQNYINLITDTAYAYGIDYWIKLYKNQKYNSAVYYYYFQFDGQLNYGKQILDTTFPGACRADELGYVFYTNLTENKLQNLNFQSRFALETVLSLLKNLVENGNPTPLGREPFQWHDAGVNRIHVVIDDEINIVEEPPLKDRLEFWYREYAKYYEYERSISRYLSSINFIPRYDTYYYKG